MRRKTDRRRQETEDRREQTEDIDRDRDRDTDRDRERERESDAGKYERLPVRDRENREREGGRDEKRLYRLILLTANRRARTRASSS